MRVILMRLSFKIFILQGRFFWHASDSTKLGAAATTVELQFAPPPVATRNGLARPRPEARR
jgi:hypothetical protein